ncbi:MAG: carboxypeptidase-like regulatory domain-containing protein, partial [Flavisolibacter sp.]
MKKTLLLILVFSCFMIGKAEAQFETVKDSVVQLFGIVMTADSLKGIEAVSVTIRGSNRGTITNRQGVFSIVVLKGDVIDFTHIQYKPKTVTVPRNLEGNQYSIVQLMIEDTVYLP